MEPPIPVASTDLFSVQFGCYYQGQAGINTVHYRVTRLVGSWLTEDIAEHFDDLVFGDYQACMTNTASYYGVRVQRQRPGPKSIGVVSANHIGPGTAGTDGLPAQVSGIISLKTGLAGHAFRGRIYIPFPDESVNDGNLNVPDGGYLAQLETLANLLFVSQNLVDGADELDLDPCIYHRESQTWHDIEGFSCPPKWATQRRRGAYGAKNAYPPF